VDCKKGPDSDKAAFAALIGELRQAFNPKGLLLSSAVSPSKVVVDAGQYYNDNYLLYVSITMIKIWGLCCIVQDISYSSPLGPPPPPPKHNQIKIS
jgi:hypothetical protein